MTIKIYRVGGSVRDELLGRKSKDIDFAVEAPSYEAMREYVIAHSKQIFLEKPEFFTIRALSEKYGAVDYVLCRKESHYTDGRRPDNVEVGTIYDDLARRDFTMNAIAITEDDKVIDPHGGRIDLFYRRLACVGSAEERFEEDALRILRAIRFTITKELCMDSAIVAVLRDPNRWIPKLQSVSIERQREELHKCFAYSTPKTLDILAHIPPQWSEALFKDLWLKPTNEKL